MDIEEIKTLAIKRCKQKKFLEIIIDSKTAYDVIVEYNLWSEIEEPNPEEDKPLWHKK